MFFEYELESLNDGEFVGHFYINDNFLPFVATVECGVFSGFYCEKLDILFCADHIKTITDHFGMVFKKKSLSYEVRCFWDNLQESSIISVDAINPDSAIQIALNHCGDFTMDNGENLFKPFPSAAKIISCDGVYNNDCFQIFP